jgi:hypothetical protein
MQFEGMSKAVIDLHGLPTKFAVEVVKAKIDICRRKLRGISLLLKNQNFENSIDLGSPLFDPNKFLYFRLPAQPRNTDDNNRIWKDHRRTIRHQTSASRIFD